MGKIDASEHAEAGPREGQRKKPPIVPGIAIAALLLLAIFATVEAYLKIADLYQSDLTTFVSP